MPEKTNLRAWVAALRSGEYAQGKGTLGQLSDRDDPTSPVEYCCLGVACRLAEQDEVVRISFDYEVNKMHVTNVADETDRAIDILPLVVMNWLGIESHNPEFVSSERVFNSAAMWNDTYNADFNEIADMIECTYKLTEVVNG